MTNRFKIFVNFKFGNILKIYIKPVKPEFITLSLIILVYLDLHWATLQRHLLEVREVRSV